LKASAKRFHQFPFMIGLLWVAALAFSPAQPQLPHSKVAALSSRPGCITAVDDLRDPAWQRDSILLLCYCGVEDLLRAASTGQKQVIGFDILQLNAQLLCSFIVAFSWVAVASNGCSWRGALQPRSRAAHMGRGRPHSGRPAPLHLRWHRRRTMARSRGGRGPGLSSHRCCSLAAATECNPHRRGARVCLRQLAMNTGAPNLSLARRVLALDRARGTPELRCPVAGPGCLTRRSGAAASVRGPAAAARAVHRQGDCV